MMDLFNNIFNLRRHGWVRRFHSEHRLKDETVYHHSASVAVLLIQALRHDGETPSVYLIMCALFHDLEEGITGDIPAPVGWAGYDVKDLERDVRQYFDLDLPALVPDEKKLLKAADFIDCVLSCLQERLMGNKLIDRVFYNLLDYETSAQIVHNCGSPSMNELWIKAREAYIATADQASNRMVDQAMSTYSDFWQSRKDKNV